MVIIPVGTLQETDQGS